MSDKNAKAHHGNTWMPSLYAIYFGILKEIAQKHGYALGVHGSFTRDMDLIAVPWVENPSDPIEMLQEFNKALGINRRGGAPYCSFEKKPHGRVGYTISTGGGGYLDISIMPILGPRKKSVRKDLSVASHILNLIMDDNYAASWQTMGQYRSALVKEIAKILELPVSKKG